MLVKSKKSISKLIENYGTTIAMVICAVLIPAMLFLPYLGSLAPTNTVLEQPEFLGAGSPSAVIDDVLLAPVRIAQYAVSQISDSIVMLRLVSVFFATLACLCFFLVLTRRHSFLIAVLASLMFASSSWVLHAARFANTEVLYLLAVPALFLAGYWVASKSDDKKLPLTVLLLTFALYIPGAWLLIAVGSAIYWSNIKRAWCKISLRMRLGGLSLLGVLLLPLIVGFIRHPSKLIEWLGVSDHANLSLEQISDNLVSIITSLFINGPDEASIWLSGTPILDFFAAAMFFIGCFTYKTNANPKQESMIFSALLIGVLLVGFGGVSRLGIIIPVVYFIIARGLAYMLTSWFTVFPRNPLARSIGLGFVFVTVFLSISYQAQRYFIVWPNSPTIKQLRGHTDDTM